MTGPVTYKNAEKKREIIKQLPLEKLLIESCLELYDAGLVAGENRKILLKP